MGKLYYKDTLLPEIPNETLTYRLIFKRSTYYYLIFCNGKYYAQTSDNTLRESGGSAKNYRIPVSEIETAEEWTYRDSTVYYYENLDEIEFLWANYDIPEGSASSSTIYFNTCLDAKEYKYRYTSRGNVSDDISMSMSAKSGELLVAIVAPRSFVEAPPGWTLSYDSGIFADNTQNQRLELFYKKVTEDGNQTITLSSSEAVRMYAILMAFPGGYGSATIYENKVIADINRTIHYMSVPDINSDKPVIWAWSFPLSGITTDVTTIPNDLERYGDPPANTPRLLAFVNNGTKTKSNRTFAYNVSGNDRAYIVAPIELGESFVLSGSVEFEIGDISKISNYYSSEITWTGILPEGTSIKLYSKIDDEEYVECTNGNPIPSLIAETDYSDSLLYLKAELSTEDSTMTPELQSIHIAIRDTTDDNVISLIFNPGNVNSIQNAIGDITVSYDGSGSLSGEGGPVAAFSEAFTPEDLTFKGHQNDVEKIVLSDISLNTELLKIEYTDESFTEHMELTSVTLSAVITHIDDI